MKPTYDYKKSYEYNRDFGPFFDGVLKQRDIKEKKDFLGFKLNSLIGIAAGPLLDSKWIKLYSELGFDILTYKTVRSCYRKVHPFPNIIAVKTNTQINLNDGNDSLVVNDNYDDIVSLSITNSFGMPSYAPEEWKKDVQKAKSFLREGQILVVSIVGTPNDHGDINELAEDYAYCALLAKEAGADIIEANFSCPNVKGKEGTIYTIPENAGLIAKTIKQKITDTPLLIKVGAFMHKNITKELVIKIKEYVDGIVAINTIPKKVVNEKGEQALPGKGRLSSGICGAAIRKVALQTVKDLVRVRRELNANFVIVGVGGIMTKEHAKQFFDLGVDAVETATGAMFDPYLGYKIQGIME
jgi:dihydroorotate dehydrogenase